MLYKYIYGYIYFRKAVLQILYSLQCPKLLENESYPALRGTRNTNHSPKNKNLSKLTFYTTKMSRFVCFGAIFQ